MQLIATTVNGLEQILADELAQLGANITEIHKRAVSFEGDLRLLYKANLHLRTALRVLSPIAEFHAKHDNEIYKKIKRIDWSNYLDLKDTFAINSVVNSPYFRHSKFIALRVKDAIVDQFRDKTGERPSIEIHHPTLQIHFHISQTKCTVLLDSSGESLHKRAYRTEKNLAPLNEVLAAGMILSSNWKGDSHFIDPMCGSGTLSIEAAMIAYNIAPSSKRRYFACLNWKDADTQLWNELLAEAKAQEKQSFDYKIIASDIDYRSVNMAKANAERAGVSEYIDFQVKNFHDTHYNDENNKATVVLNPPYGERMAPANINGFYKKIGDTLKQNYQGCEAWILSSNKDALKHIGLRSAKKLQLHNGPLICKYHKYELYSGSKKKRTEEKAL